MTPDMLASAYDRTFQLADSGLFDDWAAIVRQLIGEGFGGTALRAVGADQRAMTALDARILKARERKLTHTDETEGGAAHLVEDASGVRWRARSSASDVVVQRASQQGGEAKNGVGAERRTRPTIKPPTASS